MLFSENGSQLVHHYQVFGQNVAHASLLGMFMANLRFFTVRACADAKWAAKRDRIQGTRSPTSSDSPAPLPRSIPACKAPRAVSPVKPGVLTRTASSTIVSSASSYTPPVPKLRSVLYSECPPMLPISIPLPRFADKNFVPSHVRSSSVATQQYPSSPEFRASTVCVDLDVFGSECYMRRRLSPWTCLWL